MFHKFGASPLVERCANVATLLAALFTGWRLHREFLGSRQTWHGSGQSIRGLPLANKLTTHAPDWFFFFLIKFQIHYSIYSQSVFTLFLSHFFELMRPRDVCAPRASSPRFRPPSSPPFSGSLAKERSPPTSPSIAARCSGWRWNWWWVSADRTQGFSKNGGSPRKQKTLVTGLHRLVEDCHPAGEVGRRI